MDDDQWLSLLINWVTSVLCTSTLAFYCSTDHRGAERTRFHSRVHSLPARLNLQEVTSVDLKCLLEKESLFLNQDLNEDSVTKSHRLPSECLQNAFRMPLVIIRFTQQIPSNLFKDFSLERAKN